MNGPTGLGPVTEAMGLSTALSTQQRMEQERSQLKRRLADVEEALEILRKNPDIERLMTIMSGRIH